MTRPQPVTVSETLLAELIDTVGELRDLVRGHLAPPPAPDPTGPVEVREPEQPAARQAPPAPAPVSRGRRKDTKTVQG